MRVQVAFSTPTSEKPVRVVVPAENTATIDSLKTDILTRVRFADKRIQIDDDADLEAAVQLLDLKTEDGASLWSQDVVGDVLNAGETIIAILNLTCNGEEKQVQTDEFSDKSRELKVALRQICRLQETVSLTEEELLQTHTELRRSEAAVVKLADENKVWRDQCSKQIELLGPRDNDLWAAERQVEQLEAEMQKLIIDKSVFQEQCQQLSEALTMATRAQDGFMDIDSEVSPLKKELQELRYELSLARESEQQLEEETKKTARLQAGLDDRDTRLETITTDLEETKALLRDVEASYSTETCRSVVLSCVSDACSKVDFIEVQAAKASARALQRELQRSLKEFEAARSAAEASARRLEDTVKEHQIELKKKENLVKQLQGVLKTQAVNAPATTSPCHTGRGSNGGHRAAGSTSNSSCHGSDDGRGEDLRNRAAPMMNFSKTGDISSDVVEHENRLLQDRLSAAEELNEALQKMLRQQEQLVIEITEDNDRKADIIEGFALDVNTPPKLKPQLINAVPPSPKEKKPKFNFGLRSDKKEKNDKDKSTQLTKALDVALSSNARLRTNIAHLDQELARLKGISMSPAKEPHG
ncbi:hypothetical protein DIPPA_01318 [Diplonema papillatum]|nr:hypothetical protein DIPPA_01318 [Diplonema papillatum]